MPIRIRIAGGALVPVLAALALALAGCGSSARTGSGAAPVAQTTTTSAAAAQMGPEGVPLETGPVLASAASTRQGTTVDGIQCAPIEQLAYHIHAHLQVYIDGRPRALPAAIGLIGPVAQQTPDGPFYGAQQCYYWLHTHASDGIIHIESPTPRIYTLGDFFDEWNQPLSSQQVASARGTVTAYVDGKRWDKSPRAIPLDAHTVVQLDVGSPLVAPQPVSFGGQGL